MRSSARISHTFVPYSILLCLVLSCPSLSYPVLLSTSLRRELPMIVTSVKLMRILNHVIILWAKKWMIGDMRAICIGVAIKSSHRCNHSAAVLLAVVWLNWHHWSQVPSIHSHIPWSDIDMRSSTEPNLAWPTRTLLLLLLLYPTLPYLTPPFFIPLLPFPPLSFPPHTISPLTTPPFPRPFSTPPHIRHSILRKLSYETSWTHTPLYCGPDSPISPLFQQFSTFNYLSQLPLHLFCAQTTL